MFNDNFSANLLLNLPVKEFPNSVNTRQSCRQQYGDNLYLTHSVKDISTDQSIQMQLVEKKIQKQLAPTVSNTNYKLLSAQKLSDTV